MNEPKHSTRGTSLGHIPKGQWKFDATVASCFDDMLERSIPDYRGMREAVFQMGLRFLPADRPAQLVDLGCSLGAGMEPFLQVDKQDLLVEYVGVEESPDMLAKARERLAKYPQRVRLVQGDLTEKLPPGLAADVILCVLTMQFLPVEHRVTFLSRCREALVPGGAMIVVEKLTGGFAATEHHLRGAYEAHKAQNGYTAKEIAAKRKALEHVMTCLSHDTNVELLRAAGFSAVEGFWRRLNFAGWFAIR